MHPTGSCNISYQHEYKRIVDNKSKVNAIPCVLEEGKVSREHDCQAEFRVMSWESTEFMTPALAPVASYLRQREVDVMACWIAVAVAGNAYPLLLIDAVMMHANDELQ